MNEGLCYVWSCQLRDLVSSGKHCSRIDKPSTQQYGCVMSIPEFTTNGNLPEGVHCAKWAEFSARFATNEHRQRLASGLREAISVLRIAGCKRLYIDGSFVTNKVIPKDFDAAWEPADVDLPLLLMMEPVFGDFGNGRMAQKARFGGEFFPASQTANRAGSTFLEFFQIDKQTGLAKGIVALDPVENI